MARHDPAEVPELKIHPVTPARWRDMRDLFGPNGADAGCWCMFFRLTTAEHSRLGNGGSRRAMARLVEKRHVPGLLAYDGNRPVGYIGLGPRSNYPRLQRSRTLYPVDDKPVWSIVCFFIDRRYRGRGIAHQLVRGAISYVAKKGGTLLEAYPKDFDDKPATAAEAYTGVGSLYEAEGFTEVVRRQPDRRYRPRSIMRYEISPKDRRP